MVANLVDYYGVEAVMDMVMEECGELAQAIVHYKRATGKGFKTGADPTQAYDDLQKAVADAENAIESLKYVMSMDEDYIAESIQAADERALARLTLK